MENREKWRNVKKFWKIVGITLLLALIVLQLLPEKGLKEKLKTVYQDPWSIKKRLSLARELFEQGEVELAKKEVQLIESSWPLGLATKLRPVLKKDWQTTKKIIEAPEKIDAEIAYWEEILKEKPGYRDGLLRLAVLYHQIYEDEKAQAVWQQANQLDPNNEQVQEVGQLINQ